MIIIKILGGLGNQMFQFAFFKCLKAKGKDVKLDISGFNNYTLHNGLELFKIFNIKEDDILASDIDISPLKDSKKYFKIRKLRGKFLFKNNNQFISKTHFIENNYSEYNVNVFNFNNIYLEGYWQNNKYFRGIESEIRKTFSWWDVSSDNTFCAAKMETENSVALHIRKLDQPKNAKELLYRLWLQIVWRTCSKKYYLDAIKLIENKVDSPVFYVFTDNIPWVKKNIDLKPNYQIIDWNRGDKSNQDMYLMSKCKHNIISMSSFSWWSAWLNTNNEKIVIAPKKWAVRLEKDMGIIPSEWLRS
jgi:hypothetical protein